MKMFGKVAFSELLRLFLLPLHLLPIRSSRILFTGLTGGKHNEYSCNPGYLCEYIMQHDPGKYEIIWAVSDPAKYQYLEAKGIRLTRHFSLRSFVYLLTAKVIVSNGSYAPWFPFRRKQYFINTWHGGGAYKKNENDRPDSDWLTRRRARFCADNISLFVSSCKMASVRLFRGTYDYQGEIMEVGMPRNDFLVRRETRAAADRVRARYGFSENDRIVLYAPTFRYSEQEVRLDADRLLAFLERNGEKWHFLYRAHRYQDARMKIHVTGDRITDACNDPDMQELLAASDMLITDYSSTVWDYSFLYRPCFLYTPDLQEYIQKTGFYVSVDQWPYETAATQDKLEELIAGYDADTLRKRIDQHHVMMGCTETGDACGHVARRIKEVCGL